MGENEEKIDYETYRLFALYADGVSVAEIARLCGWASPNTVYAKMKEFPASYAEAKKHLLNKRNAKYRRVGALAVDIQLETLEYYHERLTDTTVNEDKKQEIRDKLKDISTVGESAERRADLNEGKATERVINVGMEPTKEEWEEFWKAQGAAGTGIDTESIQI